MREDVTAEQKCSDSKDNGMMSSLRHPGKCNSSSSLLQLSLSCPSANGDFSRTEYFALWYIDP